MKPWLSIFTALLLSACAQFGGDINNEITYTEFTGPQPGFISLKALGCNQRSCGKLVLHDPENRLPRAWWVLKDSFPNSEPFVGILPAGRSDRSIQLNPGAIAAMLKGQDIKPDSEGFYEIHSLAVAGPTCATTDMEEGGEGEQPRDGMPGGICGTMAVTHSLVYVLDVIDENWAGVSSGSNWDAKFLKKIYRATGDNDGNRNVTVNEVKKSHESDWNKKFKVKQTQTQKKKPENGSCTRLKSWCDDFEKARETNKDDCILRTRRPTSGHLLTVNNVSWKAGPPCRCVVETVHTGKQDGAANDFKNVPKNPGKQTWELGPNEEIEVTAGPSKNFYNRRYRDAWFFCFNKERVSGVNRDRPGDALKD